MKSCAFLSMEDFGEFVCDDELAEEALTAIGWQVATIPWQDTSVDWSQFDLVLVRSTWDYHLFPEAFLKMLQPIDKATRLENDLSVIQWNVDKTYLRDLEQQGVRITPTLWEHGPITSSGIRRWKQQLHTDELIIKPTVSGGAMDTFRFREPTKEITDCFRDRPLMVQPFLPAVVDEGEYSLFYFDGDYSHAIWKKPTRGDFRVQEEYGGQLQQTEAPKELCEIADRILNLVRPTPLYARVDFVRDSAHQWCLMELELVEPSLYFRLAPGAAERFAQIIDQRYRC